MRSNTLSCKKIGYFSFCFIVVLLINLSSVKAQTAVSDPHLGIIPAPASVVQNPGTFNFTGKTVIKADNPKDKSVALLKSFLADNRHFNNKILKNGKTIKGSGIFLTSRGANKLPAEGYKLTVTPNRITVVGKGAGLFYGIQSLIQLLPVENSADEKIPCAVIIDSPRFGYRGMMLDVSRHFFTVPQVEKIIEVMAAYKLNNFHWHLTDGQG